MSFNYLVKNLLIFIFNYMPPIIILLKLLLDKGMKRFISFILGLIIILLIIFTSYYTQNLIPFILVLIDIIYMNKIYKNGDCYKSNYTYLTSDKMHINKFNIYNFSVLSALKYSFISYAISIIIGNISVAIFSNFKVKLEEQEVVRVMTNMPINKFLLIIPVAVVFAPILEEFSFRWFLFDKLLKDKIGIYLSAIVSSIFFSIIHFNFKVFPILIWIGVFNCYLIHKKGYWYAVFNHSFFNSITTLVLLLQKLGLINI